MLRYYAEHFQEMLEELQSQSKAVGKKIHKNKLTVVINKHAKPTDFSV